VSAALFPNLLVQKYGGSSVATPEKVRGVAERIASRLAEHPRIVVAVSAMGKTTDQLIEMARGVSATPQGREFDLLLSAGEQIAVSMVGLALQARGVPAVSLTASQCGIHTDGSFNRARIRGVETRRLLLELQEGKVVIVAGFQGVTENHDVTTLGRGGGDITGAALAAALRAGVYENCTDVDGVYTADPRLVPNARQIPELSYEECIELAASGAKVLHPRAAEICMQHHIPIHVRSTFGDRTGTWVRQGAEPMEGASIVGVTTDKKVAKVTLLDVRDQPGIAAKVFRDLAEADINVRLIIQAAPAHDRNRITFITDLEYLDVLATLIPRWKKEKVAGKVDIDTDVAKIAIVGSRIASTPGLAARMFTALADSAINIDCISTSEMKVACIIAQSRLDEAVRAVHAMFFDELAESKESNGTKAAVAGAAPAAKLASAAPTRTPARKARPAAPARRAAAKKSPSSRARR
jgi:aspartate kinase